MDEEKVIDPRYIERLRSLPKASHDDKQDAMSQAMAGQAVFHPDSPFVSIEARSHVNTNPEIPHIDIPHRQDVFQPTKSVLDAIDEDIDRQLTAFGNVNGLPVIFVIFDKNMERKDGKTTCGYQLRMFKHDQMREAASFAKSCAGELGVYGSEKKLFSKEMFFDEKSNKRIDGTFYATRAILMLIEEEMKRQGVERFEDLKCPDRSTEERLQLEQRLKQAIEKEPVKMVVHSFPCAPGYESGLSARQNEEQQNCPYCHDFDGHGPELFKCNYDRADASIELKDKVISFDNSDGAFTFGEFKINYCPMCGRNLKEKE